MKNNSHFQSGSRSFRMRLGVDQSRESENSTPDQLGPRVVASPNGVNIVEERLKNLDIRPGNRIKPPVIILPQEKDKGQILVEHDQLSQKNNSNRQQHLEQLSQATFVQENEEAKELADDSRLLHLRQNVISDSKKRTLTDQSELSIGNKTAEELVGDILCSDSLEDDAILSKIEVQNFQQSDQLASSNVLESSLRLHKRMVSDQAMITENEKDVCGKLQSDVASPPSRILFSYSSQNQNDGLEEEIPIASENPFEVAKTDDRDLEEKEDRENNLEVSDFIVDKTAVLASGENNNIIKQISHYFQGEKADSTQKEHTLGITKQRSQSDSGQFGSELKSEEKRTKKRNILQKISHLVGQEESKNEATDYKEIIQDQQTSTVEANTVVNQEKLPEPPLTTKAKRGGIMSKFFSMKKVEKDVVIEEKKDTANSAQPTKACSKPIGVASRFVKFFSMKFVEPKETKKEASIKDSASVEQQPQKDESSPEKDQAYFDVQQAVDQDDSNLDMGFRANDEDQYCVDIIDHEEDRLVDEECDSDETDDEIYSAHEGLDFRPSSGADLQFSFAMPRTSSHTTPIITAEQFTHNGRQSYPTSDSSDSNQAPNSASTPSIGSFDNQNFEPRQRAQSQINQDELQHMLLQQQVNTESKEQVQFQFPETSNTKSRSPFEIRLGQGQLVMDRQPQSASDDQNQTGQYRHSAGAVNSTMNRGYEALTSIENRTTATGSHALITARTGCDKQPFALCTTQDEQQQQQQFMTNPSRQSAFVQTSTTEQKLHVEAQMRISAPFTPTRPLNSFSSHQPAFFGMDQNAQIVQQNQQMTRFSDMQLGSSQMQTLNLAVSLISNRPSAPYQTNNNRNHQNSNQQTQTRINSQSSPRSNQTDSWTSNNRIPNQGSSNASVTAQNSLKDHIQKGRDSAISNPTSANNTSTTNSKRSKRGRHRGTNKKDEGGVKSKAAEQEEEDAQKQAFKCICCNNKTLTCILEQQVDQYANLPAEERIKSMILADQQLQHFQPIDSKKFSLQSTGQNTQNSQVRAGIEGRLKDDIWHECCDCCHLVRNKLLGQMKGMASELCRDQICSKFIQVQLSRCASTDMAAIDKFYSEICRDEENVYNQEQQQIVNPTNNLDDEQDTPPESLMKNVFGNYVIQLLFEKGTQQRINQFYTIMLKQSNRLSFDQFGCRIIQKALVCLPIDKKLEIIAKFDRKMLIEMMFSEEGNYIVQCIILHLPSEKIQFIIPLVKSQVLQLCKDKRGCRVIQRMLEKFPRTDINVPIIQQIIASANELTPQQYGNYVITHILQNGLEDEKVQIINAIIKNIVKFSLYQLGSNVVENCLKGAPADYQDQILKRIIAVPIGPMKLNPNQVTLANLLENQFGNYVIQHAFNLSNDENKRLLYEKMEQAANQGFVDRQNTYAKHVYALVAQKFGTQEQKRDINNSKYRSHTSGQSNGSHVQASVKNQRNLNETKVQRRQQQQQQISTVQQQMPQKALQQHNNPSPMIDMMTMRQKMIPQNFQEKSMLANNKSEGDDGDQDDSDKSDGSDQEEDKKNKDNIVEGKTKRRRRRKRKRGCARNRKPMLCQEDILEQLSDSDRQEYLKQLPVTPQNTRSLSQSLFVFGSGFASEASLKRTSTVSVPAVDQEVIKREDNNRDKSTSEITH